jgi:hypothetical protein
MDIRRTAIIGGIAVPFIILAFIVVVSILGWWPAIVDYVLPTILYIVLILAAIISGVLLFALLRAVINLTRTAQEIRDEVIPVLDSLRETSSAVRETAKAATSFTVAPAVRAASAVVGVSEIAAVVLGRGRARKRSQERQKRRHEIEREMAAKGELNGR